MHCVSRLTGVTEQAMNMALVRARARDPLRTAAHVANALVTLFAWSRVRVRVRAQEPLFNLSSIDDRVATWIRDSYCDGAITLNQLFQRCAARASGESRCRSCS